MTNYGHMVQSQAYTGLLGIDLFVREVLNTSGVKRPCIFLSFHTEGVLGVCNTASSCVYVHAFFLIDWPVALFDVIVSMNHVSLGSGAQQEQAMHLKILHGTGSLYENYISSMQGLETEVYKLFQVTRLADGEMNDDVSLIHPYAETVSLYLCCVEIERNAHSLHHLDLFRSDICIQIYRCNRRPR